MIKKYIFLSLLISVFLICSFQVHISYCNNNKKKKEKKEKKYDDDDDSTAKTFTAVSDDNASDPGSAVKSLEEFLKLPPMPFITYGPYPFEGVDYDLLPAEVYDTYYDCYYLHTKCVRDRVYVHAVCSYSYSYGWVNFVNQCEVDLQNCRQRLRYGLGIYGYSMRDDTYFYNGDGWNCRYHFRRSDSRVAFYYEGEKNPFEEEIMNNTTTNPQTHGNFSANVTMY